MKRCFARAFSRFAVLLPLGLISADLGCGVANAQGIQGRFSGGWRASFGETEDKKTILIGDSAEPMRDGRARISKLRIEFAQGTSSGKVVALAPLCVFDPRRQTLSSSGPIEVKAAEESFALSGVGFFWSHKRSRLFISNKVETLIWRAALERSNRPSKPEAGRARELPIRVLADRFTFDPAANLATYEGKVHGNDPGQMDLTCRWLQVKIPRQQGGVEQILARDDVAIVLTQGAREIVANAKEAAYHVRADHGAFLELSGDPRWQSGPYSGRGDRITVTKSPRTTEFLVAGHARARMPRSRKTGLESAPSTPELSAIEIEADRYRLVENVVHFEGNVRARESDQWELKCGVLKAILGESRRELRQVQAERDVVIRWHAAGGESVATSEAAFYDFPASGNEAVLLKGKAQVQAPRYRAQADALRITHLPENRVEVDASGAAELVLPSLSTTELGLFPTGLRPGAPSGLPGKGDVRIRAKRYHFKDRTAVFREDVRIDHPRGTIFCDKVIAQFVKPFQSFKHILATGNVRVSDGEGELRSDRLTAYFSGEPSLLRRLVAQADQGVKILHRQGTAHARSAVFYPRRDLIELGGDPVVRSEWLDPSGTRRQVTTTAKVLHWSIGRKTVRGYGRYHSRTEPLAGGASAKTTVAADTDHRSP